jgi:hypothetical protein
MPSEAHVTRAGGISAIVGVVVLFVATLLHPIDAAPSDAPAAFAEYARDRFWVATHLGQLVGAILIASGWVALSWKLRAGKAGAWALFAGLASVASLSLAGALQAVDGIALKLAVDHWSASADGARAAAFEAAFAVRHVEIGLASMVEMFSGVAVMLSGIALVLSPVGRTWLGVFGAVAGMAMSMSGIVKAHGGFSQVGMAVGMPTSVLVLLWSICVGVFLLRSPKSPGNV